MAYDPSKPLFDQCMAVMAEEIVARKSIQDPNQAMRDLAEVDPTAFSEAARAYGYHATSLEVALYADREVQLSLVD